MFEIRRLLLGEHALLLPLGLSLSQLQPQEDVLGLDSKVFGVALELHWRSLKQDL